MPADRIERLVASGEVARGGPLDVERCRYPVIGPVSASRAIEEDRAER